MALEELSNLELIMIASQLASYVEEIRQEMQEGNEGHFNEIEYDSLFAISTGFDKLNDETARRIREDPEMRPLMDRILSEVRPDITN